MSSTCSEPSAQFSVIGLSLERRETISPNNRAGRVMAPLVSTLALMLVWIPRLRSKPVRLSRPVPASAVSSTFASTGWVGRLATARLTSCRLELSSDWEQTSFMAFVLGSLTA